MRRLSTSATLLLKIFLPTFWIVFFGLMTAFVVFTGPGKSPLVGNLIFKAGFLGFFLLGLVILYFTLLQLKRVEYDDEFLYVTNFFKTYRYPFHNIEKIKESNFLLFYTARVTFKEPGSFGKKIVFIESRQKFEDFIKSRPEIAAQLIELAD